MRRELAVAEFDAEHCFHKWIGDATPADILAWLHAHPAEAVDVVRDLRVAGPWDGGSRMDVRSSGLDHEERPVAHVSGYGPFGHDNEIPMCWHAHGPDGATWPAEDRPTYATEEEARAAADAMARAAGWVLVPGEEP